MLKYFLISSALSTEKGSCYASAKATENLQIEDIINQMIEEGSGLTRPQAMAYYERFSEVILKNLKNGCSITTPLFIIKPVINGKFTNHEDSFDAKRHQLNFRLAAGKKLHAIKKEVRIKKTEPTTKAPVVRTFIDFRNNEMNLTTLSGSMAILKGKNLKFDVNDMNQGVFFVPENRKDEIVRVKTYSDISPLKIFIQVPELQPGAYKLVVKTIPVNCANIVQGESGFILHVIKQDTIIHNP
jgi:hypothetical protein